jgi:hypothetical protein
MAPDGTVYGIELLNANSQLKAEDDGNLVVINEAIGRRQEMPLVARERPGAYKTRKKHRP